MTPTDTDRRIEQLVTDTLTIRDRYHAAVAHLQDCTGGYSSTASGAGPATIGDMPTHPDPDADVVLTVVEAQAFRQDKARDTLNRIEHELVEAANHARITARAITANWMPGSPTGQAADAITRRIDDMWCSNHRKHGRWEPRATDKPVCTWCADTHEPKKSGGSGHYPDADLIEARQRRGRLTTRDYDAFEARMRSQTSQRKRDSRNKRKPAA